MGQQTVIIDNSPIGIYKYPKIFGIIKNMKFRVIHTNINAIGI